MKMCCFGCGVEKDTVVLEIYPYPESEQFNRSPIEPLMMLDCAGSAIPRHPLGYLEYRVVVVCHVCFHALDPDMWISEKCWISLNPKVPFADLPKLDDTNERRWEPTQYIAWSPKPVDE